MFEKYLPKFINIIKFPYTANSNEKNSKYSSYGSFLLFAEAHLGRIQTSVMERFCKNSERPLAVDNSCLKVHHFCLISPTQLTFTCSKPTIETIEKGVNMLKVNHKNTRTMSMTSFWCFLLLTFNIFHTFFYCFYC